MKKKKYGVRGIVFLVCFLCTFSAFLFPVCAEEGRVSDEEIENAQREAEDFLWEKFDFTEVNKSLRKIFPESKVSFEEVVQAAAEGNMEEGGELLLKYFEDKIGYEFRTNRRNLVYILLIALAASVFSNFSSAFQNRQASEISFYILYMLLITMCLTSFRIAMEGLEQGIEMLLSFTQALCPVYFLAVAFASGTKSSILFFQFVLFLIYVAEVVIVRLLLPILNGFMVVQVMNHLLGEGVLSELSDLLYKIVSWILKFLLGGVAGISIIQGMLAPVIDSLQRSAWTKTAAAIPGVGNLFDGMTDVFFGTAVLIKNGIGAAGAFVLLAICMTPLLQMAVLMVLYKVIAAVMQPISDKRLIGCISSVSEGYALMIRVLYTTAALFLITIAIVTVSTQ